MSDSGPGTSPADEVTGSTIRRNFESVKMRQELVSGQKFRLVLKRKKRYDPATTRQQTEALKVAAQVGAAFCVECETAKKQGGPRS